MLSAPDLGEDPFLLDPLIEASKKTVEGLALGKSYVSQPRSPSCWYGLSRNAKSLGIIRGLGERCQPDQPLGALLRINTWYTAASQTSHLCGCFDRVYEMRPEIHNAYSS